jgi:AcrR family transcriptional regulator
MPIQRRNTEVRQKQIIDAAGSLIFKYGSEHLTVRGIAKEVGISEAAIYRHFKSKKSILSFLLMHIEEALLKDLNQEGLADAPVTPETIDQIIRNHFSRISMRKGISFQVVAEVISLGDRMLNKQASQMINRSIARLEDLLAAGVKEGAIRSDIALGASATMLFTMIQGLVNLWSLSNGTLNLIDTYSALWRIYRETIALP